MRVPGPRVVSESIRYGFAVGKVRVLETRAFGRATYERLLDAPAFADQLRVLSDTHYGRYLEGADTPAAVERALDRALDDFYGFLDESKLPVDVVRFFRVRHDWANLKSRLKAEAVGEPLEGVLSTLGTVPVETITGPPGELPEFLARPYRELSSAEEGAGAAGLAEVDAAVDRAMFADLLATAKRSGSTFLADLARLMVDVANLKTALRARLRSLPAADVQPMLIPGGVLRPEDIMRSYARPAAEIAELAHGIPMLRDVPPSEIADPARLDVIADDLVVRYLQRARMVAIGAEPVIAYVMAREAEVVALRVMLIGKLAGVSSEVLRGRLRELHA